MISTLCTIGSIVEAGLVQSVQNDSVVSFFMDSPSRIEQYNLASRQWLFAINLSSTHGTLTAGSIDSDGIYAAYGTEAYRYDLGGSNEIHIADTEQSTSQILVDGNILFLNSQYGRFTSVDKNSNTVVANYSSSINALVGASIAPSANRLVGRTSGISPADITYLDYRDDGTFISGGNSPYHGTYARAAKTWMFPDEHLVADSSGNIYYTTNLIHFGTFGNGITDLVFYGGRNSILLKGSTLNAYATTTALSDGIVLDHSPDKIFIDDDDVLTFTESTVATNGLAVQSIPLSSLSVGPLSVSPFEMMTLEAYEGYEYQSTNINYALYNLRNEAIVWNSSADQSWLSTAPSTAEISGGATTIAQVTVNSNALSLSAGVYTGTVQFVEVESGIQEERQVELTVYPVPDAPDTPMNPTPMNTAVNVNAATPMEWEHTNGGDDPGPWDSASRYSVYIGTNASDLVEVASGLTNTVYDPGIFDVDETYYWQVVASNVIGVATGPVWQFTTWEHGPADHFEWTLSSTNQPMAIPFNVAVRAVDVNGVLVPSYSNAVDITGLQYPVFEDNFEDGGSEGWSSTPGTTQSFIITNNISAMGDQCLLLQGYDNNSEKYYYHDLPYGQPGEVEFYMRADNPGGSAYFQLRDGQGGYIASFYMDSLYLRINGWSVTYPYLWNHWYKVKLKLNWATRRVSVYLDGAYRGGASFSSSADSVSRIALFNYNKRKVWFDDIRVLPDGPALVDAIPTQTVNVVSGEWSGTAVAGAPLEDVFLRATDAAGVTGDSTAFDVHPLTLSLILPEAVSEGETALSAQIIANFPNVVDAPILLETDSTNDIVVPTSVILPAGETNVAFDIEAFDDSLLDGSSSATVFVSASNYVSGSASILIHDNESATLTVSLPSTTAEGAGSISGAILSDHAPDVDVTVELISNNTNEIGSGSVVIPAGQTFASFSLPVLDDHIIDGVQTATIKTHVKNWKNGTASVFVFDNETTALGLQLPASLREGDGVITNGGVLSLSAASLSDIHVVLNNSDSSELVVPGSVTIPAGTNQVAFNISVVDDTDADGTKTISVLAQAPGYVPDSSNISIVDNDPHHLLVEGATNVALFGSASITVSARTVDDILLDTFSGAVALSASGDRGPVAVSPASLTNMVNGVASDDVSFSSLGNDVTLTASAGGVEGASTVFNVLGSQIVLTPASLTNTLVVAGETTSRTMVISNAGNTGLEFEIQGADTGSDGGAETNSLDVGLVAYYPFKGDATDESGNGYDGTVNGATLTADRFGNADSAYHFDGSSSYIDLGNMGGFKTVSMWVKQASRSEFDFYFGHNDFRLYASSVENGRLSFGDGSGSLTSSVQMDSQAGQWVHVVAVSDGANSKVYFNGTNATVTGKTLAATSISDVNLGRWTGGTHYLNGDLDDIRIYDRVLSDQEIQSLYGESNPATTNTLDAGLVAYYPFNGDAADQSGNGHDGTVLGGLTYETNGIVGGAAVFNGSNAKIQVPHADDLNLDGPFSIACWVKSDGTSPASGLLAKIQSSSPRNGYILAANLTAISADIKMNINKNWPAVKGTAASTNSVLDSNWHHITATYDEENLTLYLDGQMEAQTAYTNGLTVNTLPLYIGWDPYGSDRYFNGQMDEVRIYNRVLSESEIQELVNESIPAVTNDLDAGLVASYPFNGNAIDETGNGNDGTVYGATLTEDRFGNPDSAYLLDGNDYLILEDQPAVVIGTNDFTYSMWVKTASSSTQMLCQRYKVGDGPYWLRINDSQKTSFTTYDSQYGHLWNQQNVIGLSDGGWHMISCLRQGSTTKVFVDGQLVSTASGMIRNIVNDPGIIYIGVQINNGTLINYFTGVVDDIHIYDHALSDQDILDLYNEPDPADTNDLDAGLVASYPFNGDAADASGNGYDGTVVDATLITNRFGDVDSAYYFDGVNDRIDLPSAVLNVERTNSYSQSFWIKTTATDTGNNIIAKMQSSGAYRGLMIGINAGILRMQWISDQNSSNKIRVDGTTSLRDDQWHHIAVIYDGSSTAAGISVYVDGNPESMSVYADSLTGTILNSVTPTIGSRNNTYYYTGAIDDIRIYSRALSESEVQALYADTGTSGSGGSGATVTPAAAAYAFDGDATDSSGNGADGIVEGATLTDDRDGNPDSAYAFDEGTYIRTTASTGSVDIVDQISMSGWINPSQFATKAGGSGSMRTIMRKLSALSFYGYAFTITTDGRLAFDSGLSITANTHVTASGMDPLPTNAWSHVAMTYDGSQVLFYVNGVLADTKSYSQPLQSGPAATLCIGRRSYESTSDYFYGSMDELGLYDSVLSAAAIAALYLGIDVSDGSWVGTDATAGVIPPGGNQTVTVTFDASGMTAGPFVPGFLTLLSNDPTAPSNTIPLSMLVLPPAPEMDAEPAFTYGSSNMVSWSAVAGPVQYEVEVAESTNSSALQQSGWIGAPNHTFGTLATNVTYYYRARASITHASTVYAGPWSDWVWSTQMPELVDADSDHDGIPDWWEALYFGGSTNASASADSDGDGQSDYDEFISGMNPTNAASYFMINDASIPTNSQFIIYWDAVTGRVYSVHWKPSLTNDFTPMATNMVYPQGSYTDTVHQTEENGFYKVEVEMQ